VELIRVKRFKVLDTRRQGARWRLPVSQREPEAKAAMRAQKGNNLLARIPILRLFDAVILQLRPATDNRASEVIV
jgi:hypothetical protein